MGEFKILFEKIGYSFRNMALIKQAVIHSSYVNEAEESEISDNERLEFLGDAVLELAISHILMDKFPNAKEGELSRYRSSLVNEESLSHIAKGIGLGEYLKLGKGEERTGGRDKPSILADAFEALVGAIYLDSGFKSTRDVVRRLFTSAVENIDTLGKDYKTLLQEYTQEKFKIRPGYKVLEEEGPPHNKTFTVGVILNGRLISKGKGKSKKDAEQMGAKEAYFWLREEGKAD